MLKKYITILIIALGYMARPVLAQQVKLSPDVKQALSEVSADKIKADITFWPMIS